MSIHRTHSRELQPAVQTASRSAHQERLSVSGRKKKGYKWDWHLSPHRPIGHIGYISVS